jgi:hypothetical protein
VKPWIQPPVLKIKINQSGPPIHACMHPSIDIGVLSPSYIEEGNDMFKGKTKA